MTNKSFFKYINPIKSTFKYKGVIKYIIIIIVVKGDWFENCHS